MSQLDFPNSPTEGQIYAPASGPRYQWNSPVWDVVGSANETRNDDLWWPDRPSLVASVATGLFINDGKVYTAGDYQYVGSPGATAIPDLPGLLPLDEPKPASRFGADGTQAGDVTAVTRMLAAPVYLSHQVTASSLYTHPDTDSFIPVLNAFFASPEAEGKHIVFDRKRAWRGSGARPSGAQLGPQSQYITPPQRCTIEWEREWDFTGWAPDTGSPNILRREGSYGTANPITDAGGLVKGTTRVLTMASTSQYVRGTRVLIRATAELTTLTGAFTLADAAGTAFCARAEDGIVASATSTQVTLVSPVQDNYPLSCAPVIQPYLNEPEIRLVNPLAVGNGMTSGGGGDRLFNVMLGRNFQIEGGLIRNFALSVRVLSSMGGSVRDLQVHGAELSGVGGGVFYVGDNTADFLLDNVQVWGGGQPFGMAGSAAWYGITRRVRFQNCTSYYPTSNSFSQHNLSTEIEYDNCRSIGCAGAAFDLRSPNTRLTNSLVKDCAATAVLMRISPNGTQIDRLTVDGAKSGIVLENSSSPEYDYNPGDFQVTNSKLRRIGGLGTAGGIAFNYGQLRSAAVPTLGKLRLAGNSVEQIDLAPAYQIGGKWASPVIINNEALGDSTGSAMQIYDAGNGAGNGPSNLVFLNHVYPANMSGPVITNDTGKRVDRGHVEIGATSTEFTALTTNTTLDNGHYGCEFSNNGATGPITVTLPGAIAGRTFTFFVNNAQTIVLQATSSDKFRKGKGVEGAANGTLTIAGNIGAFVRIEGQTSASWNCVLFNDTADLTVA